MLAPDGRCKTLDASANGYVRAEGVGVHILRSSDSLDSSWQGMAKPAATGLLLLGTAVNQDGRSSSLTAPNGPSQQEVVRGALGVARVPATAVAGLQMHGTGTEAALIPTVGCLLPLGVPCLAAQGIGDAK